MPAIIFICTANLCRSPMACAIFLHIISEMNETGMWRVESAGVWGMDGNPAARGCQQAVGKMGLDLSWHRARTVSRELLQPFDLILTMEQGQKEALKWEFPELSERIFLLSEMIGATSDVKDPIGGSMADFDNTAKEIERLIRQGFWQIKHIIQELKER